MGTSRDPAFDTASVGWWVPAFAGNAVLLSRALDKGVHDLLVAGVLEIDRQLVVLDRAHRAVAEFLVEHPVADGEAADLADFLAARRRAAAFDQERRSPCIARVAGVFPRGA